MNVRDIFALRKEGKVEEAYEAIRPIYKNHKGRFTTLCMFWTASDVFKLRLEQKRTEEAEKIYKALQRMLPSVDDPDGRAKGFMHYAEGRLIKESEHYRKRYFAIKSKKAAKATEGSSKESEGTSEATTDLTDKTDKKFSNSLILDPKEDSCDSCNSCSSNNPSHQGDPCSDRLSRLLAVMKDPMSVKEMMAALGFGSRDKFLKNYLSPALKAGLVEMTDPDSPKSPKQRYRRTDCSSEH